MEKSVENKNIVRKIIKFFIIFFLIIIISYNCLSIISPKEFIQIFNYKIMVIEKYQEQKGIKNNTLIIAKNMNENYNKNDLVMINLNETIYVHRIVEIDNSKQYITKGDGNYKANETIDESKIYGKVIIQLPHVGIILKILESRIFTIIIVLVLIIFAMYNRRIYKRQINRRIKQQKWQMK